MVSEGVAERGSRTLRAEGALKASVRPGPGRAAAPRPRTGAGPRGRLLRRPLRLGREPGAALPGSSRRWCADGSCTACATATPRPAAPRSPTPTAAAAGLALDLRSSADRPEFAAPPGRRLLPRHPARARGRRCASCPGPNARKASTGDDRAPASEPIAYAGPAPPRRVAPRRGTATGRLHPRPWRHRPGRGSATTSCALVLDSPRASSTEQVETLLGLDRA
ncbi:hypothetical protein LV779_21220 [Streptomyces thinghirensis]|nr:hypothetical protein [Streptomyces thinghirensis]